MKRKILIFTILAALVAVPVFAADIAQDKTDWYNQMYQFHQQAIQQAVESGRLTQEQADAMNARMQQMAPIMRQAATNGGMMGFRGKGPQGAPYGPCFGATANQETNK
jgi:predicted PurR-regulated permease PerM